MDNFSLDQLCWSEFLDETSELFCDIPRSKAIKGNSIRINESYVSTSPLKRLHEAVPENLPELGHESDDSDMMLLASNFGSNLYGADRTRAAMLNETNSPVRGVVKAFRTGGGLSQKIATLARLSSGTGAVEILHTAHNLESSFLENERLVADVYQQCLDEFGQQFIDRLIFNRKATNRLQSLTINLMGQIMDLQDSLNTPNTFDLGSIPYLKRESERCCHATLEILGKTREKLIRSITINTDNPSHEYFKDSSASSVSSTTTPPPIPAKAASRRPFGNNAAANPDFANNVPLSSEDESHQIESTPDYSGDAESTPSPVQHIAFLAKNEGNLLKPETPVEELRFSSLSLVPPSLNVTRGEAVEPNPRHQPSPVAPRPDSAPESSPQFDTIPLIIRPGSAPHIQIEPESPEEQDIVTPLAKDLSFGDMIRGAMRIPSQYGDDRFSFQSSGSEDFSVGRLSQAGINFQEKQLPPLPLKASPPMTREDLPRLDTRTEDLKVFHRSRKDLRKVLGEEVHHSKRVTTIQSRVPETPPPPYTTTLSLFPRAVPTQEIPPIPARARRERNKSSSSHPSPVSAASQSPQSISSSPVSPASPAPRRRGRPTPRSHPEDYPPFDLQVLQSSRQQVVERPSTQGATSQNLELPPLQRRRTNSSDLGFGLPLSPPHSEGRHSATEDFGLQSAALKAPTGGDAIDDIEHVPVRTNTVTGRMSLTSSMPTPASSIQSMDLTLRHDNEFFQMGGFCEGGQMMLRGEKDHYKVIKRPVGAFTSTTVAKCVKCSFELGWQVFEKDLVKPLSNSGIYSTGESSVRYRASFLTKSHVHSKSSDQLAYACLFCYEENRTLEEYDATVFFSVSQLMHHIAKHARPVRSIYGLKVAYNDTTDVDFDVLFTSMESAPDPLADVKSKISSRPKAIAIASHRPKSAKFQEKDPERQATLQFASGARIVGITFPSRFNGQWCGGYHDGQKGMFPASMIQLEKPAHDDVVMNARSTLTATARWDFKSKDSSWLSFNKGDRITSISYPYADHWCYFGQNSKGKFGLFPAAFVENMIDECGLMLSPRASMGSSTFSGRGSGVGTIESRGAERLGGAAGKAFSVIGAVSLKFPRGN